ncbi:hypothetical protein [Nitrincola sp. MINF-07-Sa-05]|uniref:hypothetical protein n=1 Tax=Nitrincola salilacus TaxID=3400273 RepID=UPI003918571F
MNDIPTIRRRCDGSIDTEYYLDKGLSCRSKAAQEMVDQATDKMHNMQVRLVAFAASFPITGSHANKELADNAKSDDAES